jgi:two-component system cell cycle sensor histidine kinase/response regulator CckA
MEAMCTAGQTIEGSPCILLVDDENVVLEVGAKMLTKLGCRVIHVKGGKAALAVYEENYDQSDMVILDMILLDMGGGEVYDRMRHINPNVRVLLSSAFNRDMHVAKILNRGCNGFIQKPFRMTEISGKITEILTKE